MNVEIIVDIKTPHHTQHVSHGLSLSFTLPEPVRDLHWCKKGSTVHVFPSPTEDFELAKYRSFWYGYTQWALSLYTPVAVWFVFGTKSDKNWLQQTVKTAEKIISAPLPALVSSKVRKRQAVVRDPSTVFAAGNLSHVTTTAQ